MREDAIQQKASSAANKAIRAMIRNAMAGAEKHLPAAAVHARHEALMEQVAAAQAIIDAAAKSKRERIERHELRQAGKLPPSPKVRWRDRKKARRARKPEVT